ncbi:MAG: cell division protein FtsZ [Bacteroidales bacterium]|nr:cell division protein FtsZ [Bacteroidales bacterium]
MTDQEFNEISADQQFEIPRREDNNIILAVGVGGGGSNAVGHMYKQNIEGVSFAICNTDKQALQNSPIPKRVLLGAGLGAGGIVTKAAEDAEKSADAIRELFTDNIKMVFVTAGMGGGTGTGAGPVVARIAKEKDLLTIGIVTIPFLFEGDRKIIKALEGAEEMGKYVDALLMINNERLTEIYPDLHFLNAFEKADDTLAIAARSISDIITQQGLINRDFNDVNSTLRNGGTAIISTGFGEGEHRVTKAIEDALHSPLLKNRDITSSKRLLFVIYFSPNAEHQFQMAESQELTAFTSTIDSGVDIIYGVYPDPSMGEKVKITILASGFEPTMRKPEDNHAPAEIQVTHPAPHEKPEPEPTPSAPKRDINAPISPEDPEIRSKLEAQYGADAINKKIREKIRKRQIILTPDQLDNDAVIEGLEKNVAFERDTRIATEISSIHTAAPSANRPRPATSAAPASSAPASDTPGQTTPGEINFLAD